MRSRNMDFSGHWGPGIVEETITRGSWPDWRELMDAAVSDRTARESIRRIVRHFRGRDDPYFAAEAYVAAWEGILAKLEEEYPLE